jgi:4-hydroxy-tetrahydrodipicolinate reductase
MDRKTGYGLGDSANELLNITSDRIDPAPGTHHVKYSSVVDDIELIHTAHSRMGFATGAVVAAEWLQGKSGIFGMDDLLNLNA